MLIALEIGFLGIPCTILHDAARQGPISGPGKGCHVQTRPLWCINAAPPRRATMTKLRKQLIARVANFGVEERALPGRNDGFASLCYRGKPFAHFHNDNELDLHLTRSIIAREGLIHPSNSVVHPKRSKNAHWIELRLKTVADLGHAIRLVKLAVGNMAA